MSSFIKYWSYAWVRGLRCSYHSKVCVVVGQCWQVWVLWAVAAGRGDGNGFFEINGRSCLQCRHRLFLMQKVRGADKHRIQILLEQQMVIVGDKNVVAVPFFLCRQHLAVDVAAGDNAGTVVGLMGVASQAPRPPAPITPMRKSDTGASLNCVVCGVEDSIVWDGEDY